MFSPFKSMKLVGLCRSQGQASTSDLSNPGNLEEVMVLVEIPHYQYMFGVLELRLMREDWKRRKARSEATERRPVEGKWV